MQNTTKNCASTIICNELSDVIANNILLLVSGGSSAQVAIDVLKKIPSNQINKINILLADERYVDYNSPSSNAKLLKILGINKYTNNFFELLESESHTRDYYNQKLSQMLKDYTQKADYIIAILGIGADGHTAGILPGSVAESSESPYSIDYSTDSFERITIAPNYFNNIDHAYVYAQGPNKESILNKFLNNSNNLPMDLIKKAKKYSLFYNEEEL